MATIHASEHSSASHQQSSGSYEQQFDMGHDLVEYLKDYAREKPEVAALWCFGIGFILGWKLKPW